MKTVLWGAAMSVGLLALVACGGETPPAPKAEAVPVPAVVVPVKSKLTTTIIDPTLFGQFMIVPSSGDTGQVLADGTGYEIRSVGIDRVAVGDGDGVLVRIQPEIAAQLGGRKVKVTVTARTATAKGSPSFKVMYYRPGSDNGSGWQEFPVTTEYAPYTFEYLVPAAPSTTEVDNIGFWADIEGKGRGIEVSGIAVETVD